LPRVGREARLSYIGYIGHVLMENRNGLVVAGMVTEANGTAERDASAMMLKRQAKRARQRITVGEDKAYDTQEHIAALRTILLETTSRARNIDKDHDDFLNSNDLFAPRLRLSFNSAFRVVDSQNLWSTLGTNPLRLRQAPT
jgi:hypothetical protein